MFKKLTGLACVGLLLGLAGSVSKAENSYTDGGTDHLWKTPANWSNGVPFMSGSDADNNYRWANMDVDATVCIVDLTHTNASASGFYPGASGGENEFYMTGGSLSTWFFNVGRGNSDSGSDGYFKMTGGQINTEGFKIPNQFNGGPGNITGHVDLHGGTIYVTGWFLMGSRTSGVYEGGIGTMDVCGGTLIINGNHVDKVQGYINNGWITACNGPGEFELDYGQTNTDKTTLTTTGAVITQAWDPDPDNNTQNVSLDVVLSWSAGAYAASHNVYFGTTNPPPFDHNQPLGDTDYAPGTLAFNTTYYWQIDEVNEPNTWPGDVWSFTTGGPPSAAQNAGPADSATGVNPNADLTWTAGTGAELHDVYFGTTPPGEYQGGQTGTMFDPGPMDANTTYHWRIDEKNSFGTTTGAVWSFTIMPRPAADLNGDWVVDILDVKEFVGHWLDSGCSGPGWCEGADLDHSTKVNLKDYALLVPDIGLPTGRPPYTDYCAMLSQEIQGKKHGFMAGNLTYYIGGHHHLWNKTEDETLGLTHPFFHDLRSRGTGMVQNASTGYGHDLAGSSWDFYQFTKIAYGTVIIGSTEYVNPVPTAMYWRPDKMICEYSVGGVNIHEEKFIADNDAACSIITSDAPITLKFKGQSLWSQTNSVTSTATCSYNGAENVIHIAEGGTMRVIPCNGCSTETGVSVYDGMSTVVSASRNMTDYSATNNSNNQWFYEFKVSCDSSGVAIIWAMDDEYSNALNYAKQVRADPAGKLAAKTEFMNELLNYQIPYFRCSDSQIVDIYYFLWSIYLMYYIDVQNGWEQYPHTQTAVNNFLGMHRYDAVFQIQVGSWTVDKEFYANGNALIWSALLPYSQGCGKISDNMGIAWHSGFYGPEVIAHVPGTWQIYEHSGDLAFLNDVYNFYKALFWDGGVCEHWGYMFNGAEALAKMANELGYPSDAQHWYDLVNMDNIDGWLDARWDSTAHIFLPQTPQHWTCFAYMGMNQFPDDWAWEMTEYWATNDQVGFFAQVPLTTRAIKDWGTISHQFTVTPDTNWYSIRGMYMHHVGTNANLCGLGHLKGYNLEWGIPVAPESLDINFNPWGDQYSNFNAGKILLILEGIAGPSYSVIDDTFTTCDHLPAEWDYMEVMVPITENGQTRWTTVRTERADVGGGNIEKTVTVTGNSQSILYIQPWLEEGSLVSADPGYVVDEPIRHIGYTFQGQPNATVSLVYQK